MKKFIPYILIGILILGFIGAIGYLKNSGGGSQDTSVQTEAYFDENANVMYFYSSSCSACIKQKPILEELAGEGYRVKPMNIQDDAESASQYNIKGTPEFISQNDGERLEGFQEKEPLRKWLEEHK